MEERPHVGDSATAVRVLSGWFLDADRESFAVLMLNAKNRLIGISTISVGSLTSSLVHPREVFKPLILHNAAAVILAHNHPSGDPTPSREDNSITQRLVTLGDMMGIRVIDHIIIGDNGRHYSYLDSGALPLPTTV
ncbi:MAG: JAB domain-containing protein [Candidatus Uhrbacteria bacterium]|nr:JAB domain-containing protein [Candidatus Uhrbacteria bacterium]